MDSDKSTFFGLVLVAVVAFLASIVLSVSAVCQAAQNVMIAYFPAVPVMFAQVTFLIFTAIVLLFVYKLFVKRWFYDDLGKR